MTTLALGSPYTLHCLGLLGAMLCCLRTSRQGCTNGILLLFCPLPTFPVFVFTTRCVLAAMIARISYFKVLNSIVLAVLVYVVDVFTTVENATKMLCHHKSMLQNISARHGHRMVRHSYVDVALHNYAPPARSFAWASRYFSVLIGSFVNASRHINPLYVSLNNNIGASS